MRDQPIKSEELDPNLKLEVIAQEAACDVTACFCCGTCTAGCPIHAVYPEHDPRKITRMINLGMRERALSSPYIWYCDDCYLCEKHCPQNVKFSSLWAVLKNMAAKEGYPPPVSLNQDMCSGCGICVASCPYSAIELQMQNERRVAHLVTNLCQGCGACAAACPSAVISVNLFEDEQIFAEIEALAA
ncbi:MAG: 4Fe-4S dicluster domain-containing protein [Dehalococcoidia bacterium]|nr:MAG: 4Fe-4S dicluster domain-containing protein [Dehalococcoidia bacterium]